MNLAAFRFRIVASAVGTALLAVVLVWATAAAVVATLSPRPRLELPPPLVAACRADPGAWVGLRLGPAVITGYDERGNAPDASVPPLALAEWPELPPVGETASRDVGSHRWELLTHAAERGPCSFVLTRDIPPPSLLSALQWGASLGAFVAVLAVGASTYAVAVRPLVRRIDRIRGAALGIGSQVYASADDPVSDALGDISGVLDRSHARIVDDRAELVRRQAALEQYLAEIAHDLRTPIGSLVLALQEVGDEAPSPASRRALTDAAYLGALVENLHQAARLRHGLDPLEGVTDLADVVARLEVRFQALGALQGVSVAAAVPDQPVMVRCTPVLAERAVANLLQNATSHGARQVAAQLTRTERGFTLVVRDDGPGVAEPADLALRTFSDRPDRPRGPGLGLAITNEIAARAGWTVAYRGGDGGGLEVELSGARLGEPLEPSP